MYFDETGLLDFLNNLEYKVRHEFHQAADTKTEAAVLEAAANLAETFAQELRDAADKIRNKPQGINPADISY